MNFILLYFSGTGNTSLIASEIGKRLQAKSHEVTLLSIEDIKDISSLDLKDKIIGFGYPVYKFSYPEIFDETLTLLNGKADFNHYFLFSTYARFEAQAHLDFSNHLDKAKFHIIGQESFKAPSCGISARLAFDEYEYQSVMFFENHIKNKLNHFVHDILKDIGSKTLSLSSTSFPPSNKVTMPSIVRTIKKNIVSDIEITKYPKLRIKEEVCTTCGLCAKKCPDQNLIRTSHHIDIVDDTGCLHCLRCINHCPQNAISFGQLTEGHNQYSLKIRDDLFRKANNGFEETYWDNFPSLVTKWKIKTLKYWIRHRFSPK